ncbi:solute carrier family 35 member E2B isoform X2 [Tamandua tetradactyla]|uniref:solute carrier family 35 member E2B isoform X2 n=1 Tax=Tamandua tetradactyla TaxID=48850 RepID=UPI0040539AAE
MPSTKEDCRFALRAQFQSLVFSRRTYFQVLCVDAGPAGGGGPGAPWLECVLVSGAPARPPHPSMSSPPEAPAPDSSVAGPSGRPRGRWPFLWGPLLGRPSEPGSVARGTPGERVLAVTLTETTVIEAPLGAGSSRALLYLVLWFIFSVCTLFLNKHILSLLEGEPSTLDAVHNLHRVCEDPGALLPAPAQGAVRLPAQLPVHHALRGPHEVRHGGPGPGEPEECGCLLRRDSEELCPPLHRDHVPDGPWGVHSAHPVLSQEKSRVQGHLPLTFSEEEVPIYVFASAKTGGSAPSPGGQRCKQMLRGSPQVPTSLQWVHRAGPPTGVGSSAMRRTGGWDVLPQGWTLTTLSRQKKPARQDQVLGLPGTPRTADSPRRACWSTCPSSLSWGGWRCAPQPRSASTSWASRRPCPPTSWTVCKMFSQRSSSVGTNTGSRHAGDRGRWQDLHLQPGRGAAARGGWHAVPPAECHGLRAHGQDLPRHVQISDAHCEPIGLGLCLAWTSRGGHGGVSQRGRPPAAFPVCKARGILAMGPQDGACPSLEVFPDLS